MIIIDKTFIKNYFNLLFSVSFYRFGADVMEIVASWTKTLCTGICQNHLSNHVGDGEPVGLCEKDLADWSVLDIGTGNGLLVQEFAKQG